MKALVFSMLAMAAMVSCTSESDPIDNETPKGDEKVEIKMTAGVIGVETSKAVVNSGDAFNASFFRANGESPTWKAVINPINTPVSAEGAITFTDPEYYPADGSNANFVGISPQVLASTETGTVSATITGDEDLMYAGIKSGNRLTLNELAMSFDHLLTQVKFVVKTDASAIGDVAVESIKIKDANTVFAINLADGKFASSETPTNTIGTGTMTAIKAGSDASNPYMIEPIESVLKLIVNATGYAENQEISINQAFKAGTSYTVTLTFKDKAVSAIASVTPWSEGNASGNVE